MTTNGYPLKFFQFGHEMKVQPIREKKINLFEWFEHNNAGFKRENIEFSF